jgi:lipopolysaccharide/colanic/teichoic acid biosynthesis glycosyltransferase
MQYVSRYTGEELDILQVRPGITDYSSIEFVNLDEIVGEENADEMYEKLVLQKKNSLRVKYAHTVSFKTDMHILFRTAAVVLEKIFGFVFRKQHQ